MAGWRPYTGPIARFIGGFEQVQIAKRHGIAVVLCLLLLGAGCSSGGSKTDSSASKPGASGANDIAPADRADLADGGKLTWPIDTFPSNFNLSQLDGALADGASVMGALMPSMFNIDPLAQPVVNTDYATSAVLTATEPKQIVTYKLNPKATWDDGTPITEADFEAQWKALSGKDKSFHIASSNGYENIESVVKGSDDKEIVVTFAAPYVDWQGLFSPLYPASTNKDATVFNDGWKEKALTTAGPFKMAGVDTTAQTINLVRNDKWWGRRAKLDTIIFRKIDRDAQADALSNGEIDLMGVGSDVNRLKRAEGISGVTIHHAAAPNFNHMTINGTSAILSDINVRKALAQAIDRDAVAKTLLGPLGVKTAPLGNHIYMTNQKGYQDNSTTLPFDIAAAGKLLDDAGWKMAGDTRMKDGKPLSLRLPLPPGSAVGKQISELVRSMAQKVGIKIDIQSVPGDDFFPKYVSLGNFDIVLFGWSGTPFPVTSAKSIYAAPKKQADGTEDVQQNYARIGTPDIDKLFNDAAATFDADKQISIGNEIDKLIWAEVHSLTIYQVPDIVATKAKLSNFGSFGFATVVYEDIGYKK
ncbi:MAG: glutathione transport system substrate-binding protein [Actinomycetota bacterium]|nr:glutathione transport system substrate-binding protein [Actinomycetota bacterium]